MNIDVKYLDNIFKQTLSSVIKKEFTFLTSVYITNDENNNIIITCSNVLLDLMVVEKKFSALFKMKYFENKYLGITIINHGFISIAMIQYDNTNKLRVICHYSPLWRKERN